MVRGKASSSDHSGAIADLRDDFVALTGKVNSIDERTSVKIPGKLSKLEDSVRDLKKALVSLKDRVDLIEENMPPKKEFDDMQKSVKSIKGTTIQEFKQMEKMHGYSLKEMEKKGRDMNKLKKLQEEQGKTVQSLYGETLGMKTSVTKIADDVNLLDDVTRKAVSELDELYAIDHRTQKHLTDLEIIVDQIKTVVERDNSDHASRLDLKLEYVDKEISKLFKFQLLLILVMGVVTFWCLWWQYRLYRTDPRSKFTKFYKPTTAYHSEL